MFLVIDNYDSFTYNLVHLFGVCGAPTKVVRNDRLLAEEALGLEAEGIVLSPGPGVPEKAGICVELIQKAGGRVPIFGVCLGLQAIAKAYGGRIIRAKQLMHGKLSAVNHRREGVFAGIPSPFAATRYHSLVVDPAYLPQQLCVNAQAGEENVMALSHQAHPVYGVQFHPESIASEHGGKIVQNFIGLARAFNASAAAP